MQRINGATLWANMHLLFWLSLVPFATAWMGETKFALLPTALYGLVLILPATAYAILQRVLIAAHPDNKVLARAVGADFKGKLSLFLYASGIALASSIRFCPWGFTDLVAIIWCVPDSRIEKAIRAEAKNND